jgi:hypothetical protein
MVLKQHLDNLRRKDALIHAAGNLASFLWSWRLKVCAHVLLTDAVRRNDAKLTAVCMREAETAEISVRLGHYSTSHFEGAALTPFFNPTVSSVDPQDKRAILDHPADGAATRARALT